MADIEEIEVLDEFSDDEFSDDSDDEGNLLSKQKKKVIDTKTFKINIKNIRIMKPSKDVTAPVVYFIIRETEEAQKEREAQEVLDKKRGKKSKGAPKTITMKTEALTAFDPEDADAAVFTTSFEKYWEGVYEDLARQELVIQVYDYRWCCRRNEFLGESTMNLGKWAAGQIRQLMPIFLNQKGKKAKMNGELSFLGYFQEMFQYEISFTEWRGSDLKAADDDGTSDPYLVVNIPPRSVADIFKAGALKGGYFNRSCKSLTIYNSLYPFWEEVGTLNFFGTRSDLENSMLHFTVYDWDRLSIGKHTEIGRAIVPMRGVIDYESSGAKLKIEDEVEIEDDTVSEVKTETKIVDAGYISGNVKAEHLPPYHQKGDVAQVIEGVQYLAVKLRSAKNLMATDENGLTDCFVTLEWDGQTFESQIVWEDLNPVWGETIHIPVRIPDITAQELQKKGAINVQLMDYDEEGNDLLGSFQIPLWKITSAPKGRYAKKSPLTRIYKETAFKVGGPPVEAGVDSRFAFDAWFQPDLPDDLKLTEQEDGLIKALPDEYQKRYDRWLNSIPAYLRNRLKFPFEAFDDMGMVHFLPDYIGEGYKLPGEMWRHGMITYEGREFLREHVINRMVQCFTFASAEASSLSEEAHVWKRCNFFLQMKKGNAIEHAICLANLLIELKAETDDPEEEPDPYLDVYVCLGTTKKGRDHAWVMTRNADKSITFFEPTNSKRYILHERWEGKGLQLEHNNQDGGEESDSDDESGLSNLVGRDLGAIMVDPVEEIALKQSQAKKKKSKKKEKKLSKSEREDQERMKELEEMENARNVNDTDIIIFMDDSEFRFAPVEVVRTNEIYEQVPGSNMTIDEWDNLHEAGEEADGEEKLKEVGKELVERTSIILPYETLDVLFNTENVFANIQHPNPTRCMFDMDNPVKWNSFISFEDEESTGLPKPSLLQTPTMIKQPLDEATVADLELSIFNEISEGIKTHRHGLSKKTEIETKVSDVLKEGLKYLEHDAIFKLDPESEPNQEKRNDMETKLEKLTAERQNWQQAVTIDAPAAHNFLGVPINFFYTDAKKIRREIMDRFDWHDRDNEDMKFGLAVKIFPYHGGSNSVWVYYAIMEPVKEEEDD